MHRRSAHTGIYHVEAQMKLEGGQSKARWTELEIRHMANEEAKVITTAPENLKTINQILSAKIPGRTLEAKR